MCYPRAQAVASSSSGRHDLNCILRDLKTGTFQHGFRFRDQQNPNISQLTFGLARQDRFQFIHRNPITNGGERCCQHITHSASKVLSLAGIVQEHFSLCPCFCRLNPGKCLYLFSEIFRETRIDPQKRCQPSASAVGGKFVAVLAGDEGTISQFPQQRSPVQQADQQNMPPTK